MLTGMCQLIFMLTGMCHFLEINSSQVIIGTVKVWLIGSSIIKQAFTVARRRPGGASLDLKGINLWWQGYSGMSILDVVSKLKTLKRVGDLPDIILLHCGGNDLGRIDLKEFCSQIDIIIKFITVTFKCKIIWSQILPRNAWRYSDNHAAMDLARKRVNSYAAKRVIENGGFYLKHPDLSQVTPAIFTADGVHLSFLGNCLFLAQISSALEAFVSGSCNCFE